ncbi:uncharacterized protein LOC133315924 [Gastrolobium bilobum]|uniref:uncharacterized protein LOC133315924 n=1 Tax=Gastrolobium bilobum TaxID=150636 RepID=UPI002AAF3031|nr:uncharacterized protein LOC133315924 [Gastrolobium bilobum]
MTHLQQTRANEDWTIFVDGSSNVKRSGAGVIVESPQGITLEHSIHFGFKASNNQAEYEAVLAGLAMAKDLGAARIILKSDSQLVVAQVQGNYQAKEAFTVKYLEKVRLLLANFERFTMDHIPREQNSQADILYKLASTKGPGNNRLVIQQSVPNPSIIMAITKRKPRPSQSAQSLIDDDTMPPDDEDTWMTPIWNYLTKGVVPPEPRAAKKLACKASFYTVINNHLYKKGFSSPLLKCLDPQQARYVISEVHEGIGEHHMGGKSLSRKLLRAGYFWPSMEEDSKQHVLHCVKCQEHADLYHASPEELSSMISPWPFYQWGMDILGPFPIAVGEVKWLSVAIDYFSKWIEAEALATITANRICRFFYQKIICRFGVPHTIITDNGMQFADKKFNQILQYFHIKHRDTLLLNIHKRTGYKQSLETRIGKNVRSS